jgi:hypothetical protein
MNLSDLIDIPDSITLAVQKMIQLKKSIIKHLTLKGDATIAELSSVTTFSIPTVTKIIAELINEEIVYETGKIGTAGGRRPSQYGINPDACYYLGVEVNKKSLNFGIQNFKNSCVKFAENISYKLENTKESLDELCRLINEFVEDSGH